MWIAYNFSVLILFIWKYFHFAVFLKMSFHWIWSWRQFSLNILKIHYNVFWLLLLLLKSQLPANLSFLWRLIYLFLLPNFKITFYSDVMNFHCELTKYEFHCSFSVWQFLVFPNLGYLPSILKNVQLLFLWILPSFILLSPSIILIRHLLTLLTLSSMYLDLSYILFLCLSVLRLENSSGDLSVNQFSL